MLDSAKSAIKRLVIKRLVRIDAERRRSLPGGFGALPPECWGYEVDAGGDLKVEGSSLAGLAERFGTPLYVVNVPWLRKTHDEFVRAFRAWYPTVNLGTSYKTNPVPAVLETLHAMGTYAEVISEFELWLASELGMAGDKIIVNGPGKGSSMIARAVDLGVRIINIDGLGEIDVIAEAAKRVDRQQVVGVRVVTSVGWSSQFGLSIASGDAFEAFRRIAQRPGLRPKGIHLHIGTGLKSVHRFLQAVREVMEFGRTLRDSLRIELQTYDFGGGFGVPTVRSLEEWDERMIALGYPAREAIISDCPSPGDYGRELASLVREFVPAGRPLPEVVLEPGRAITSSAQSLLLRVIAVKEANAARKLILDGGKNITLPLGWETHKILPAKGLRQPFDHHTDLYGPLCHPGDVVARHMALPRLGVGDAVVIMDAGAYFVPNQMNFSNPRPAIVTVEAGHAELVRVRESFDDIVRLDLWRR